MQGISEELLKQMKESAEKDRNVKTLNAAMAKGEYADLAYVPLNGAKLNGDFAVEIKTSSVTYQKRSGRCWLFAVLNILREKAAENMKLERMELSENYLSFYDKLEKCNNFLEMVIANADKELSDRMMEYILSGIGDGGYFDMARDLIQKYGVIPVEVMPDNYQSTHTEKFTRLQNSLLRKDAALLRAAVKNGEDAEALKEKMLTEIYKAQCIAFGTPVEQFDYSFRDKDGEYHQEFSITPKEFYDKYVGIDLNSYVTVINHPTDGLKMNGYYCFHYMGNMAGVNCRCLNLSMQEMQKMVIQQLKDGVPVWFGCDSGAYGDRMMGVWDPDSFDYEGLLGGIDLTMSKKDRLMYHDSFATHAMLLTGVDFDANGNPVRWKIENSWGEEVGKKGYFVCSQKYFEEYVYEAILLKDYFTEEQLVLLKKEPIEILPWQSDVI